MTSTITTIIGLLVAIFIFVLIRKDRLHVSQGLGWIAVAIGFSLLGFAPGVIDQVAQYFGVAYPPVLALTLGIAVLVIKILLMDIERSRIELRNQRLIQRVAMLEADLKKLRQSTEHSDKTSSRPQQASPSSQQ
ncbi:MAG: DUF2304 domain-containing protein [Halioglobus sp.]